MVLPSLIALVTLPIYTHTFTPAEYGYYVVVNSAIMLAATVGVAWLETAILRFYAEYEQRGALQAFVTTVAIALILSLLLLFVCARGLLSLLHLESQILSDLLEIGLWVFVTTSGLRVLLTMLRAGVRASEYAILQSINIVGGILLGLLFAIPLQRGIAGLLYGTGLLALALIPVTMIRLRILPYVKLQKVSRALLKDLAAYGFPMAPALVGNWALSLADRYIIEYFRPPAEIGWYSASYSFAEKALVLPFSALMFAATPILIAGWELGDRSQVADGLEELSRWYLLLAMPLLVGISVLAKDLVGLLVTDEFMPGYLIVPYVALGVFLWGLAQYVTRTFVLMKKSSTLMLIVLISGAVNILSNLLLVPSLGFIGAGISTTIGYGTMLILSLVLERPYHLYRFPLAAFGRIGLSALAMGLVVWSLNRWSPIPPLLLVPIGGGLYLGCLLAVREFRPSDLRRLWAQVKTDSAAMS
jgi:O-antigen/teichoic acid export membrane protein